MDNVQAEHDPVVPPTDPLLASTGDQGIVVHCMPAA